MTYFDYHINNSYYNRTSVILISIIGGISAIITFFRISSFKTGIVTKVNKYINRKLARTYYLSEGLLKTLNEKGVPAEDIKEAYSSSEKTLVTFRQIYLTLEKTKFFNNTDTKQLSENTLNNLYEIESKLRVSAFYNATVPEDKKLTEIAAQLSLS